MSDDLRIKVKLLSPREKFKLLEFYIKDPEFGRYMSQEIGPFTFSADWSENTLTFIGTHKTMSVVLSKFIDQILKEQALFRAN